MLIIFGCTLCTSCDAIRHYLGLYSMAERHKKAQAQAYLKICRDKRHPLHEKNGSVVYSPLKRGTEWIDKASRTISLCCNVVNIRTGRSWVPVNDDRSIQAIAIFGRECREWPREVVRLEIQILIEKIGLTGYLTVCQEMCKVRLGLYS